MVPSHVKSDTVDRRPPPPCPSPIARIVEADLRQAITRWLRADLLCEGDEAIKVEGAQGCVLCQCSGICDDGCGVEVCFADIELHECAVHLQHRCNGQVSSATNFVSTQVQRLKRRVDLG